MGKTVALCLDERSCRNPEVIGLAGERLEAQEWLRVFPDGDSARRQLKGDGTVGEVWVLSCDDVEPINLAASIKADNPALPVCLVTAEGCGSLFSRAHTAGIDEVVEHRVFLKMYAQAKQRAREEAPPAMPASPPAGMAVDQVSGDASVSGGCAVAETAEQLAPPRISSDAVHMQAAKQVAAPVAASTARKGFVMPIVSGSGGAGKSSVSVVAAFCAASRGNRTLLLDCDLQFGDVAFMIGKGDFLPIDVALAHPERLEREISGEGNLAVLAAPARLEDAEEVVRQLPGLIDSLAGRFDVVIANTGAAWAEQHAVLLERSSAALFLIDQRMSSVRACRHALELCARCGIASGPFRFALNRCAKGAPLSSADVAGVLQDAAVYELKDGGRDVEDCLSSGAAEELMDAGNEFVQSVDLVMERLLPPSPRTPDANTDTGSEGFLLTRRRGRHSGKRKQRKG